MTRPETTEALARVLRAHLMTCYPFEVVCDCEWTVTDDDSREGDARMIAAHVKHAVAALLAAVEAGEVQGLVTSDRLAQAWDEGFSAGVSNPANIAFGLGDLTNPYRARVVAAMSERLRDVLAAHDDPFGWDIKGDEEPAFLVYVCNCGEESPPLAHEWVGPKEVIAASDWHRAHVETVVLAWLGERLADEAVVEAVARSLAGYTWHDDTAATAALTAVRDALGVPVRPAGGEVAPGEDGGELGRNGTIQSKGDA